MIIKKIAPGSISMADVIGFAKLGAFVESSRIHVGPTTAALPHFHAVSGTPVATQVVDTTFYDNTCTPHLSVSTRGTFEVGDPSRITYMMQAERADEAGRLSTGDSVANWHTGRIKSVFPTARLHRSSQMIRENPALVMEIAEASWEFIAGHQTHGFKHYIESDGSISKKPAPDSVSSVLENMAMIGDGTGWKIPNVVTIVLDIILGSRNGVDYYHLCGGAMWKYIDEHNYMDLVELILNKMKRYGREMYLVNTTSFRVFSLKDDAGLLDEVWHLYRQWKNEGAHKKKCRMETALLEKVRGRKMPWYDGCEGKHEITQHDLETSDDMYVPAWALHANFAELAEFVAFTVKTWRSRKKQKE